MNVIVLIGIECKEFKMNSKLINVLFMSFTILIFIQFFNRYYEFLFMKQESITEFDKSVIADTENEDKIFYDFNSYPTMYYFYKNRMLVNRLTFLVPWWLDDYEDETIADLLENKPKVCIYDTEMKVWEITGYDSIFQEKLNENYNQINDKVWIRNDV